MKSILLILFISAGLIASECDYYSKQAVHYMNKVKSASSWCAKADALEMAVNNLSSAKRVCANGYELNESLQGMSSALIQASVKCGK